MIPGLEFVTEKKTFSEARKFCADRNKDLGLPRNNEENDLMQKMSKSIGNFKYWVDATDEEQEGMSLITYH